jgi:hypothetical protein
VIWLLLACAPSETTAVEKPTAEACAACGGECLQEATPAIGRTHVETDVDYPSYPPSSGNHDPCWAEWGVYTEPLRTENWVHNLEHGGVVFVYASTIAAADLAVLTTWVEALPEGRAILTPAAAPMDAVVAAVSWEHRLLLGCFDGAELDDFFWDHVGRAPEDVTSGPSETCTMAGDTAESGGAR